MATGSDKILKALGRFWRVASSLSVSLIIWLGLCYCLVSKQHKGCYDLGYCVEGSLQITMPQELCQKWRCMMFCTYKDGLDSCHLSKIQYFTHDIKSNLLYKTVCHKANKIRRLESCCSPWFLYHLSFSININGSRCSFNAPLPWTLR